MVSETLDETDKRLLSLLQRNSRQTAVELAEQLGVSDNTVHNRIERLEESGVIDSYTATIPPKRVGLDLYFLFICTARISDRSTVAEKALEFTNVVEVTELMTGNQNLHVKAVGADDKDITAVAERLDNLELEINAEFLIRDEWSKPLDYTAVN